MFLQQLWFQRMCSDRGLSDPPMIEFPFSCNNGVFLLLLKTDAKFSENG